MPASNPNKLDAEKFATLRDGIKRFGFLQPILVKKDCTIVDGVHRVQAARELGLSHVPAVVTDISDEESRILQVAMNRLRGELDVGQVAVTLHELASIGLGTDFLALSGFNMSEVDALIAAIDRPEPSPGDATMPADTLPEDEALNEKPYILELAFATRPEFVSVKRALRKAAGGGRQASLEKGLLALIKGA